MPKQTRATDPLREDQKQSSRHKPEHAPQAASMEAGRLQRLPAQPAAASASDVAQLQSRYGNRAVQRLLDSHTVQAKLEVGPADDAYEQQADRVAQQVMRAPAPAGKDEEEKLAG